jgi:APA family basic amino acid/polyamine antiporter
MNLRIKPVELLIAESEAKGLRRSLGPTSLTLMGIGAIVGTGIFVLTAEAAQKAGPAMILSFLLAGLVCLLAALCYAELASMVPVSGSAYTYSYAVFGELVAWVVGWALLLEYAVAGSAVAVGWSNYLDGWLARSVGIDWPDEYTRGYFAGGLVNVPAALLVLLITVLLMLGTRMSARLNAVLVAIKVAALLMFIVLSAVAFDADRLTPFSPYGWYEAQGVGVAAAAATVFFAFIGFDALSTAAEESRKPQRDLPLGLLASILLCTVLFAAVAAGVAGTVDSQPIRSPTGEWLAPGSGELSVRCASPEYAEALVCSGEPLAFALDVIGWDRLSALMGIAAFLALPSVVLMMLFGQSRVFFAMARDGLLPFHATLARVHPTRHTPHRVTLIAGLLSAAAAALWPVGQLADIANSGILFAFMMVALGVLWLRWREPQRHRPFRVPLLGLLAPATLIGCGALFFYLPTSAKLAFLWWTVGGLACYLAYGLRHSPLRHPPTGVSS